MEKTSSRIEPSNKDSILISTELKLRELFDEIEYLLIDPRIKSGTQFQIETSQSKIVLTKK